MNQVMEETIKVNFNETQLKLVMDLAEDFAPFVSKIENGTATTKNNYGAYGAMLSKLSKGDRKLALIFAYALKIAGANAVGVSDAIDAFFPEN